MEFRKGRNESEKLKVFFLFFGFILENKYSSCRGSNETASAGRVKWNGKEERIFHLTYLVGGGGGGKRRLLLPQYHRFPLSQHTYMGELACQIQCAVSQLLLPSFLPPSLQSALHL